MGTRHNIVFMDIEHKYKNTDGEEVARGALKFNKNGKLNLKCIKDYPKVYVHWDGYPLGGYDEEKDIVYGGALSILKEFLNSDGARARANDTEYLSAYYIGWKIIHDFGFKNLKELDDYRSIGIETSLNDWADYTYIIKPEATSAKSWKFVIYVLGGDLKLIKKVENINDLESYKDDFL